MARHRFSWNGFDDTVIPPRRQGVGHRSSMHRPRATIVGLFISMALLVGACSGSDSTAATTTTTNGPATTTSTDAPTTTISTTTETTAEAEAETNTSDVPESAATAAADQITWFLTLFNGADIPIEDITDHFTPEFLDAVPIGQVVSSLPDLSGGASDWAATTDPIEGLEGDVRIASEEAVSSWIVSISVEAALPHLIEGLRIAPDQSGDDTTAPEGYDRVALDEELAALGPDGRIGIYEVTNGSCEALHEVEGDVAIPLGSTFKLWILAALADDVATGVASWDDTIIVQENHFSSPDGQIFSLGAGAEVSLFDMAAAMISISDNSATDHLLAYLGREKVEAILYAIGIEDPEANIPMMSTGALFELKFLEDEPNVQEWDTLDTAGRNALLDIIEEKTLAWIDPEFDLESFVIEQPTRLDLEWFATPQDLCRTMIYLDQQASTIGGEPIAEILSINAGVGFDDTLWPDTRFKGGSEPGVIAFDWWMRRNDGRAFVVAGGVSDPDTPLVNDEVIATFGRAIGLIAELAP